MENRSNSGDKWRIDSLVNQCGELNHSGGGHLAIFSPI